MRQVPLHKIAKENLADMMREIELLNFLDHPNIVKYLATLKTKDHLNIVLEFVENGSLANTVAKFGSLPQSLVAIYIHQVTSSALVLAKTVELALDSARCSGSLLSVSGWPQRKPPAPGYIRRYQWL